MVNSVNYGDEGQLLSGAADEGKSNSHIKKLSKAMKLDSHQMHKGVSQQNFVN
jgi:hypothetical protein